MWISTVCNILQLVGFGALVLIMTIIPLGLRSQGITVLVLQAIIVLGGIAAPVKYYLGVRETGGWKILQQAAALCGLALAVLVIQSMIAYH